MVELAYDFEFNPQIQIRIAMPSSNNYKPLNTHCTHLPNLSIMHSESEITESLVSENVTEGYKSKWKLNRNNKWYYLNTEIRVHLQNRMIINITNYERNILTSLGQKHLETIDDKYINKPKKSKSILSKMMMKLRNNRLSKIGEVNVEDYHEINKNTTIEPNNQVRRYKKFKHIKDKKTISKIQSKNEESNNKIITAITDHMEKTYDKLDLTTTEYKIIRKNLIMRIRTTPKHVPLTIKKAIYIINKVGFDGIMTDVNDYKPFQANKLKLLIDSNCLVDVNQYSIYEYIHVIIYYLTSKRSSLLESRITDNLIRATEYKRHDVKSLLFRYLIYQLNSIDGDTLFQLIRFLHDCYKYHIKINEDYVVIHKLSEIFLPYIFQPNSTSDPQILKNYKNIIIFLIKNFESVFMVSVGMQTEILKKMYSSDKEKLDYILFTEHLIECTVNITDTYPKADANSLMNMRSVTSSFTSFESYVSMFEKTTNLAINDNLSNFTTKQKRSTSSLKKRQSKNNGKTKYNNSTQNSLDNYLYSSKGSANSLDQYTTTSFKNEINILKKRNESSNIDDCSTHSEVTYGMHDEIEL
ncbi:hypothetical protein A3Q56_04830 [Intoshia linei]|uniref:Rho-GAP domain-containing protein n=1 Tax=Intoshia linei TaxID=1819745 RepID=A0A177AZD9_9BILA|nr:hypothetical protein A3Q56_04830 [Intoshia linei]